MDSTTKMLASRVSDGDRGAILDEDLANSGDEDELIVDVVGGCEDDSRIEERCAETTQHMHAQIEDTGTRSHDHLICIVIRNTYPQDTD